MSVSLEEGRELVKGRFDALCPSSKWYRDQDVIPRGEVLALLFVHPRSDLSSDWIGAKLYDAGFTSYVLEHDPDTPNVYRAVIYRFTVAEVTPASLMRNYLEAYYVAVLKEAAVGDFLTLDFVTEGKELMDSLKSREPIVFDVREPLPLDSWIYLIHRFTGQPRPAPEFLSKRLRAKGYKAFVFSEGIGSAMFAGRDAYLGENTVAVLFNPGSTVIDTVEIAQEVYGDLIDDNRTVGIVGVTFQALVDNQQVIEDAYAAIIRTEQLGNDLRSAGEGITETIGTLGEVLGIVGKAGKYLVWGGLIIGTVYIGRKLYLAFRNQNSKQRKMLRK